MIPNNLLDKARPFFDKNAGLALLYITADGNIFYPHSKALASGHARAKGIEVYTVTRADIPKDVEKPAEVKVENPAKQLTVEPTKPKKKFTPSKK